MSDYFTMFGLYYVVVYLEGLYIMIDEMSDSRVYFDGVEKVLAMFNN